MTWGALSSYAARLDLEGWQRGAERPCANLPAKAVDQLAVARAVLSRGSITPEEAAAQFAKADVNVVAQYLETLALLGEATVDDDGRYGRAVRVA